MNIHHKECSTFLLPCEDLTIFNISILRFCSDSKLLKFACYFLLFGFSFFYYLWAFLSNFPIDFVELWATFNCYLISPFFSRNFSTRSLLLLSSLSFRDIFFMGFSPFYPSSYLGLLIFFSFIVEYNNYKSRISNQTLYENEEVVHRSVEWSPNIHMFTLYFF